MTDVDTAIQEYREAHSELAVALQRHAAAQEEAARAERACKDAQQSERVAKAKLAAAVSGPLPDIDWRVVRRPGGAVS